MTSTELVTIAGILLSLFFSYFPKANLWFAAKDPEVKRAIMLLLILVVAAGSFGLACWSLTSSMVPGITCDQAGLLGLFKGFVLAAIANQTAYALSPQTSAVKKVKAKAAG